MSWFKRSKKAKPEEKTAEVETLSHSPVLNGNLHVAERDGETKYYHSFVRKDLIFKHGLRSSIITGEVKPSEDGSLEKNFFGNIGFLKTLYTYVDTVMRRSSDMAKAAENQVDGYVYIIDQRTPDPAGRVPPFDILGGFKVDNKVLGEFQENKSYLLKSENGFLDLGPTNNAKFNEYLEGVLLSEVSG